MYAQLVYSESKDGKRCGPSQRFYLDRFPVVIGRGEEADVRLADRWVSRTHCRIEERNGVLYVIDLSSKHGTWINEARVEEAILFPGAALQIGLTTFHADYEVSSCQLH
jgi:pSer/pThr/pTyr-binding forkhead associated (FHA) protein